MEKTIKDFIRDLLNENELLTKELQESKESEKKAKEDAEHWWQQYFKTDIALSNLREKLEQEEMSKNE